MQKTDWWTYKPRKICLTRDSVKLHTGVGMRHNLWLVKRLEDGSWTRRRDVGNLQGQCGLVPTKDNFLKTHSWKLNSLTEKYCMKCDHSMKRMCYNLGVINVMDFFFLNKSIRGKKSSGDKAMQVVFLRQHLIQEGNPNLYRLGRNVKPASLIHRDTHPCVVSLGIQQRNSEGGSQVRRVEHISESQTTFTQKSKSQSHFPLTTTVTELFSRTLPRS